MLALILSAAILSPSNGDASREAECRAVDGTYAIYANHDLLHIDGSRHLVEVTSPTLDAELQRRGWEDTVARGTFRICGPGTRKPESLNMQDRVRLRSWTDVRFKRRKAKKP